MERMNGLLTLADFIRDFRRLNDAQVMHLMRLLGYKCPRKIKNKLERRLALAHHLPVKPEYDLLFVWPDVSFVEQEGYDYYDYLKVGSAIRKLLIG